jgi:Cu(I)/Ag(I) efflux system membrane protein CusA/SilA
MIANLIRWSLANRFLVLIITALTVAAGIYAVARHSTPFPICPMCR